MSGKYFLRAVYRSLDRIMHDDAVEALPFLLHHIQQAAASASRASYAAASLRIEASRQKRPFEATTKAAGMGCHADAESHTCFQLARRIQFE